MIQKGEFPMTKEKQFISVVAYVHNNEEMIERFIETVMEQCEKFIQSELIFVDDYSSDKSIEVIEKYFKDYPSEYIVSIVKLGRYHGMEAAMNAGRDIAIGDFVYEFDSLFVDYDGNIIMDAYYKCLEGHDVVMVSTDVPIKLTSRLFYKIFNTVAYSHSNIGQVSFRLLSRRGINRVMSMGVDIPYRQVIYLNSGLSTASIKYKSLTGNRPAKNDKSTERIDLALDSFIFFTNAIQRTALLIATLFALLSLSTIIYAIISRVLGYHHGMGWLSTMLFMALGFMGMFGFLAVIVKYLSVLVDLVFKRQKYLISDIKKIASK